MRDMGGTNCRCVIKDANPNCPLCDGTGRISGDLRDERRIEWKRCSAGCVKDEKGIYRFGIEECFRCAGTGRRAILHRAVNPASIKATSGGTFEDVIYHLIDKTVKAWGEQDATIWTRKVFVREYCYNGTQEMKAQQMHISTSWYEKQLHDAHARIDVALYNRKIHE